YYNAGVAWVAEISEYSQLRDELGWQCNGDPLYRDGVDHFQTEVPRFARAVKTIGPLLKGAAVYDIGSYPGYGIWAFRECSRYMCVGKCPEWFESALKHSCNID